MANLGSILNRKDITLLIKPHTVRAMVYPVVIYGYESWTIKKAEHQVLMLFNCSAGKNSWESFEQQDNQTSQSSRKSTLNILWKD